MKMKAALIMLDLQNDFCKGGPLEVPEADDIIPLANQLQKHFELVVAANDWHPKDHVSFASNHPGHNVGDVIEVGEIHQILWQNHGVQNTKGAEFHPKLDTSQIKKIFYKGYEKNIDSYSAFYDMASLRATGLAEYLAQHRMHELYFIGVATEYCVKYSCLDAVRLGFKVNLIEDACCGMGHNEGDIAAALAEMRTERIKVIHSDQILKSL